MMLDLGNMVYPSKGLLVVAFIETLYNINSTIKPVSYL